VTDRDFVTLVQSESPSPSTLPPLRREISSQAMTKRKKDIDYSSEDSASDFEPTVAKRPVVSRRKRRATAAQKVPTDERAEASVLDTYATSPHPRSRHLIASPDLMRPSLLKWYSGAHEVRGMPWRKPFDPSLDADARAQRAYEVRR
jgi:A/G-specific adenine glycosylase